MQGTLHITRGNMFYALLPLGVLGDAWLQAAAHAYPNLRFVGTFPGLVVSDLPASTFPRWAVSLLKLAMAPIASTDEETGLAHATILVRAAASVKRVTYWNHLLEARTTHPLAYDEDVSGWLWRHLESTAEQF